MSEVIMEIKVVLLDDVFGNTCAIPRDAVDRAFGTEDFARLLGMSVKQILALRLKWLASGKTIDDILKKEDDK